jgi:hypothetical protein
MNYKEIAEYNDIEDPAAIHVGHEIYSEQTSKVI